MSRYPFKKRTIKGLIRYTVIENTSKMAFREKKDVSCKNNISIIRNLEI